MNIFSDKQDITSDIVIEMAVQKALDLGINFLVVASCTGKTALQLHKYIINKQYPLQIICISHQVGFTQPGVDDMPAEARMQFAALHIPVLTTTHALAGVDRALRFQSGGIYPAEIVANTLRMFGQGVKVCVEVSSMAKDAGLIPHGEDIIALAGTGQGADTAIVLTPAHVSYLFETNIKEIIIMPRGH